MSEAKRVMIIGLDCAAPKILFDDMRSELPVISGLMERGVWGELESCDPPITVPAWSCMMSSKDPGTLGFYGFRNRKDHSYDGMTFATNEKMKHDRVWDILSRDGRHVVVLGVPMTFPPRQVNGEMISCFLAPSIESRYTYPEELRDEIAQTVGEYMVDVPNFRTDEKERIMRDIKEMTRRRFALARHLRDTRDWDFLMMVEMGTDRLHHGFWRFYDHDHPDYQPGTHWEEEFRAYYRSVDAEIGSMIEGLGDDTAVLVVSDHGAQSMVGGIQVNEWLQREGYLRLTEQPDGVVPIGQATIDWPNTRVWADGGYYSRIFLNVRGREPEGTVDPADYEALRDELIAKLEALGDEQGNPIGTRVFRPQDLYHEVNGVAPDLICYFGNLTWRSIGSLGDGRIQVRENDTGPDDANHAKMGVYVMAGPGMPTSSPDRATLFDIAPTVLTAMGYPVPADMQGQSLV
ncbi:MAG TPA: alkaline phosphatase family protein [Gaiellales bacterium]|jgi:predicted AlkP superfamily phosphohydrolase/phosphomutase|nr:alkaline phosphatase family protein [Gaiellales bacterium]